MKIQTRENFFESNCSSNHSLIIFNSKDREKLLHKYQNGNYEVLIYSNGTKIKQTNEERFEGEYPETINLKITNKCDLKCKMCLESSRVNGKEGSFNYEFFNSLKEGVELAIGGGNPLNHKELIPFLKRMKNKKIICNICVNQDHFMINQKDIQSLLDEELIKGMAISINKDKNIEEIVQFLHKNDNAFISVINGIVSEQILKKLYDKGLKIQIQGFKYSGRGRLFLTDKEDKNMEYLENNILEIIKRFKGVSFDNASIRQLKLKNKINDFNSLYMRDDGDYSLYVNLADGTYSTFFNSDKKYKIKGNISDMFKNAEKNEIKYHIEYYLTQDKEKMLFATLKEDDNYTFFFNKKENDWEFSGLSFNKIKESRKVELIDKSVALSIGNHKLVEDYFEEYFGIVIFK